MTSVVIPLRRRVPEKGPWTNQELAEFYRVTEILNRAGMAVSTESGLTDEGDPWLVFVRDDTADVVAHFARVDGEFIAVSSPTGQVVRGTDFRDLINRLMRLQPLMLPQLQPVRANVYLHPSVVLVAFVAMALLLSTSKPAEAADGESSGGSTPLVVPPTTDGTAADGPGGETHATAGSGAAGKQAVQPVAVGRDSSKDAKALLEVVSLGRGAPTARVEATLNGQQMVSLAAVVAVAMTIMEGQPDSAIAASAPVGAEGDADTGAESARSILAPGTQVGLNDDKADANGTSLANTTETAATAETDVSATQALRAVQGGPAAVSLAEVVIVPPVSGDAAAGARSLVFPDVDAAVNGVLLLATAAGGGSVVVPVGAPARTPVDNLPPDIVVVQTTTGAEFRIVPVATTQAIAGFTDLVEIRFEIIPPPKPPATDAVADAASATASPPAGGPTGQAPATDAAAAPDAAPNVSQPPLAGDAQGMDAPDVPAPASPVASDAVAPAAGEPAKGDGSVTPAPGPTSGAAAVAPAPAEPAQPVLSAPVVQTPAPAPPATSVATAPPVVAPPAPTPAAPAPTAPIDPGNIVVVGRGIGTGEVFLTAGIDTVIFTGGGQIVHGFDFATDRLVYDRASVDVTSMKANFLGADTLVLTFGDGSFIKLVGVVNADLGFG